jgi:hypothetical protein
VAGAQQADNVGRSMVSIAWSGAPAAGDPPLREEANEKKRGACEGAALRSTFAGC